MVQAWAGAHGRCWHTGATKNLSSATKHVDFYFRNNLLFSLFSWDLVSCNLIEENVFTPFTQLLGVPTLCATFYSHAYPRRVWCSCCFRKKNRFPPPQQGKMQSYSVAPCRLQIEPHGFLDVKLCEVRRKDQRWKSRTEESVCRRRNPGAPTSRDSVK